MTITPVPARPAAAAPGSRAGHASDPEGFAALVSREADRLAGGCCEGASADAAGSAGPDGGTADAPAGDVPAGAVPPGVVLPEAAVDVVPAGSLVGRPGGDHGSTGEQTAQLATTAQGAPTAEAALVAPVTGALGEQAGAPRTGTSGPGGVTVLNGNGSAGNAPATGGDASPTAAPADGTTGATADASGEALGALEPGTPAPAPSPSASATVNDAGTDVVGAPATATGAAGGEAAGDATPTGSTGRTTAALLDQVSPTLTRMVSRGDGEHRMTLKIHPADLGEVHLTVTVRGERVDVDIAASAEARELLRDGLTQLRALLDPTGRGGGQLVFRDLPNAPAAGQPVSAETGTGGDPSSRSGSAGADGSADSRDGRGPHPGPHAARTAGVGDVAARPAAPPARAAGSATRTVDLTI